jgi:hypothetical protein
MAKLILFWLTEAKKRTIVAIIAETKGDVVIYWKNPLMQRNKVSEITLDMAEHEQLPKNVSLTQLVSQIDSMRKKLALKHYKR